MVFLSSSLSTLVLGLLVEGARGTGLEGPGLEVMGLEELQVGGTAGWRSCRLEVSRRTKV